MFLYIKIFRKWQQFRSAFTFVENVHYNLQAIVIVACLICWLLDHCIKMDHEFLDVARCSLVFI